ncbi:MAG: hypothetical protein F6J86_24270 [Symploca sp. SIO1B1]|nr:hypothetical protein [Symploca sp. SIO1B1]
MNNGELGIGNGEWRMEKVEWKVYAIAILCTFVENYLTPNTYHLTPTT